MHGNLQTVVLESRHISIDLQGVYLKQRKTHSNVSIQWLEYLSHIDHLEIHYALNQDEVQYGPFFLDVYAPSTPTAYQFAGCFYHGYEHCFNACHLNPVTKKTYWEIRKQFQLKVSALKINHVLNGRCC